MTNQTQAIRGLLTFLPLLQNREAIYDRIGYWGDMTSRVSTAAAKDLFQYLYQQGFILDNFDWMQWSDEALSYEENRTKLATADLPTLYKILTTHIRADRVTEGHYDSILENGFLADVLTRMKEIVENN